MVATGAAWYDGVAVRVGVAEPAVAVQLGQDVPPARERVAHSQAEDVGYQVIVAWVQAHQEESAACGEWHSTVDEVGVGVGDEGGQWAAIRAKQRRTRGRRDEGELAGGVCGAGPWEPRDEGSLGEVLSKMAIFRLI